jgi:hypothetical protein
LYNNAITATTTQKELSKLTATNVTLQVVQLSKRFCCNTKHLTKPTAVNVAQVITAITAPLAGTGSERSDVSHGNYLMELSLEQKTQLQKLLNYSWTYALQ